MILKGPEGPFQWTYGTVITWTLQWERLCSIDALNGWRMRIFSPGSTVVGILGDTFFLGHLTLSDPRGIKAPILFLQVWSNLCFRPETYSSTQMLCVTVVDLKEKGYIASLHICIHFCSTLLPTVTIAHVTANLRLENEWLLVALSQQITVNVNATSWIAFWVFY